MRLYRCVLFAVALVLAAAPSAHSLDMAKITCRSFAATGHDNMAAVIMWLRGYHAGRTGIVAATDISEAHAYGKRLGHYCKQHPDANLIDASEQILSDEDRGI
jgi:hypothetical protein